MTSQIACSTGLCSTSATRDFALRVATWGLNRLLKDFLPRAMARANLRVHGFQGNASSRALFVIAECLRLYLKDDEKKNTA